jgi:hypothetical protein
LVIACEEDAFTSRRLFTGSTEAIMADVFDTFGHTVCTRGRPSSYTPSRCDEIKAIMHEGYTVTAAAGMMGVARLTLYRWAKVHPDFCYALALAKGLRVLRWERELLSATDAARVRVCIAALRMDEPYRRTTGRNPL